MADSYYENVQHDSDSVSTGINGAQQEYDHQQQQQYAPVSSQGQGHGHHESEDLNGNNGGQYTNGLPTPAKDGHAGGAGVGSSGVAKSVKKALTSWVGFSNLPNQVHRRSVR